MNQPLLTLETARLQLIALTADWAIRFAENPKALEADAGLVFAEGFPVFPHSMHYWKYQLRKDASLTGWASWLMLHRNTRTVIGDGGFKGKPDAKGEVELGYALVEPWRNQGYCTEFVSALVHWAFAQDKVVAVTAETLPDGVASQRVLDKCGFIPDGHGDDGPRFRRAR